MRVFRVRESSLEFTYNFSHLANKLPRNLKRKLKNKGRIEIRPLLRTFWFCNPQRKRLYSKPEE